MARITLVLPIVAVAMWGIPGLAQGQRASQDSRKQAPLINTGGPLTLAEMVGRADRIFLGEVAEVRTVEDSIPSDDGQPVPVEVLEVVFNVAEVYKGECPPCGRLVVRQLPEYAQPVEVGEELLWFLPEPAEDGGLGLTAPLGIYSGHFKIFPDPDSKGDKVAANLLNNEGLWTGPSLWESASEFDPQALQDDVKERASSAYRVREVMNRAARPNRPAPIPLDLLTSAAREADGRASDKERRDVDVARPRP